MQYVSDRVQARDQDTILTGTERNIHPAQQQQQGRLSTMGSVRSRAQIRQARTRPRVGRGVVVVVRGGGGGGGGDDAGML